MEWLVRHETIVRRMKHYVAEHQLDWNISENLSRSYIILHFLVYEFNTAILVLF